MSRDDDFSGDGAVDPRLGELLSDYREFLDEVPAGESMPEDVALNIREAIAREPMPSPTKTPVNRSMLALAASVAVIGIGIGATVIVTNQPDVQQEPIRASAVDDGSARDEGGATTQPLPSNDFTSPCQPPTAMALASSCQPRFNPVMNWRSSSLSRVRNQKPLKR